VRVAVTGGSGFIGSHVVERLIEGGHEVSCLVLPGEGPGWLDEKAVDLHTGSVLEPSSLPPFLEGCDAIVHLAGLTRARNEEEFLEVNATGTVSVIEAALGLSRPPRHIVAMSSIAAVGPGEPNGTCLDEDTDMRPLTAYGRSKAALEERVRAYRGRIEYTFIRAPGVYGPRDRDFLEYFRLVRRGLRVVVGPGHVLSFVYVKNLADAILSCLLHPNAYGQAFFIADDGAYNWDQFAGLIETALDRRTIRVEVPVWVAVLVGNGASLVTPFLQRPALLSRDKVTEMRQACWIVSTDKAERLLGFRPRTTTAAALRETAAWYLEQGWI
jgi:dihydroflavonol-4-reductase